MSEQTIEKSEFQDMTLQCKTCDKPFVWTASEQEFYRTKGLAYRPTHCPECRQKKRESMRERRK
jgi:Zn finger protein HypA/HybF involved in hydrogenase expression